MPEPPSIDPELRTVLGAMRAGVLLIEAPGTILWANATYFEATGRSPVMLGQDYHRFEEPEGTWSPAVREAVDRALRDGRSSAFSAVRARYRSASGGVYFDIDVQALPPAARERPARALVLLRDATDRVAEAQRASLFYESFRSSTNPMQLTDARGVMIDVNPAFEKIYGYSREECIGRRPNLVRSRHTPSELYDRMWADLADPKKGYWAGEIFNRDRHGRERPVLLSITAVRSRDGAVTNYLGVAVDQSEQRSWELRAAHADKLASLGQLAAGVAHEINTPLANVMLVTESLRRRSQDPWVLARLGTLTDQVEVAARIVRGLLDFARREEPHVAEVDLRAVGHEAAEFLRGKQSADVEVREEYPAEPLVVRGDHGQLMQVLTNLLNNAYDAMSGRGTIRIAMQQRGDRIDVEVVDSGPGIPTEVLPHIFEPFFTTKPEGEGTGLGLAICHGIVQAHHGSIVARNVPGAGAGFLLSFPEATARPTRPSGVPDPAGPAPGPGRNVLPRSDPGGRPPAPRSPPEPSVEDGP